MASVKCVNCGGACSLGRGRFVYRDFGLPLVLNGIEVARCSDCGEQDPIIPNANDLMKSVAWGVVRAARRLTGDEIRFLRKYCGQSAREFAKRIGVNHTDLSKYENGRRPVSQSKDRLIRILAIVMSDELTADVRELVERFKDMNDPAPKVQPELLLDPETMECRYA